MKTVYLHVGNFKTGTSAIQKFCSDHRRDLMSCGFDYLASARPSSNRTNHGKIPISLLTKYRARVPHWYDDKDTFFEVSKSVREEVENSSSSNIVISSEEFYRIAGNRKRIVRAAGSDVRKLFSGHRARVIMYVREPLEILKSWYNEVSKSNRPLYRFTDFFLHLNNNFLLPQRNAKFWRATFGESSLIVEPYSLSGSEHIQRFLDLIGAEVPKTVNPKASVVNRKRSDETIELDRISRIMLVKDEKQRNAYMYSFAFENATNTQLVQDKIDKINRRFQAFCHKEGLHFPNSSFSLGDIVAHENRVNPGDVIDATPFRRRLAQVRDSSLVDFIKRVRRMFN
jgi:hypothetical protein